MITESSIAKRLWEESAYLASLLYDRVGVIRNIRQWRKRSRLASHKNDTKKFCCYPSLRDWMKSLLHLSSEYLYFHYCLSAWKEGKQIAKVRWKRSP